jgi:hypothetical protein
MAEDPAFLFWPEFGIISPEFGDSSWTSLDSGTPNSSIIFQIPALTSAGIWLVEIRR